MKPRRIVAECTSVGTYNTDPFYPVPKVGQTFTLEELIAFGEQERRALAARGHHGTPLSDEDMARAQRALKDARDRSET